MIERKKCDRAHVHFSWNPSTIVKCYAARTLKTHVHTSTLCAIEHSVLERTWADLSTRKKTLIFIIYSFLFPCNPTLGGAIESKNTTFVVPRSLQTFFIVSLLSQWFQLIVSCLLLSWEAKPSNKVEDEASSMINSCILVIYAYNLIYYLFKINSMALLLFMIEHLLWFHALFNIHCVPSGGTSSDWVETNIHRDLRIQ